MMRFIYFLTLVMMPLIVYSQNNHLDDNDLRQGYWKLYFPYNNDSILSEEGLFVNNVEDGLWIKYHDNGQVREIIHYKNGKLDGVRISISKKGKLNEQEFFLNGQYHGLQLYFHDTAKKKIEINYVHGMKEGQFIRYYKNGKKQEEAYYTNDQKHGFAEWYFDNEQLSMQYKYSYGMIIDTAYAYYKNGKLKTTYMYYNNTLNGEKKTYYPSGLMKEKGRFKEDDKHGDWCTYDSLGYQTNCVKYKNGVIE